VLHHVLDVAVGDEERDVVALDRDPAQDDERLGAHGQEPGELVAQDPLRLVGLLDPDRETHGVDRGLYQDAFRGVARDQEGRQERLGRGPRRGAGETGVGGER